MLRKAAERHGGVAGGGKWNPEMEMRFGLLLSTKVESGRVARGQGTSPSSLMGWGSCCAAVLSRILEPGGLGETTSSSL